MDMFIRILQHTEYRYIFVNAKKFEYSFLLNPIWAYINIALICLFFVFAFFYTTGKIDSKTKPLTNTTKAKKLFITLMVMTIGTRFFPADYLNSIPLRVISLPHYVTTIFVDSLILFTLSLALLQIKKYGNKLLALFVAFLALYLLMIFTTFFHLKRIPVGDEFNLGTQIFHISPFEYLFIAIRNKPIQFILGFIIPLSIVIFSLKANNFSTLILNFKLKKHVIITLGLVLATLFSFVLFYKAAKLKYTSTKINESEKQSQNLNRFGLIPCQVYTIKNKIHINKKDYTPEKLEKLTTEALVTYPSDPKNINPNIPQVIITWSSESFFFPERVDPNLKNPENINKNFKKIIAENKGDMGISSAYPLFAGGTVYGESNILSNMSTTLAKQEYPSMVSYYKSLGYTTVYIHLVNDSFYNYYERSKFLGFDEIYLGSTFKTEWGNDDMLFKFAKERIDKAIASNEKLFINFIDITLHGPYRSAMSKPITLKYGSIEPSVIAYIIKSIKADEYLGDLVDFIDQKNSEIAFLKVADHVPSITNKQSLLTKGEDKFSSEFLFYHNKRKLNLSKEYNYIHQSLVPALFLQSLGMPLRPIDKYMLDKSKNEKTYKLPIMKQASYDLTLGLQVSKPLFELKE